MITPTTVPAPSAQILAQQRAMPITRLMDCGMEPADARELMERTTAGEVWDAVAAGLADAWLGRADDARRSGHRATALEAYRFGAAALLFAQMAFNADTDRKRELYRRFAAAVASAASLMTPSMERIEPAYGGGVLSGWLMRPATGEAAATVIVLGGLSGWGAAYLRLGDALVTRGLAALLVEGPGQGQPRFDHGLYLDAAVNEAYSRFVDEALAHDALGASIGIWGNSFGGLFAALTAARDPRMRACCVNGAPAQPTLPDFRTAREQIFAAVGSDDPEQATQTLRSLQFDPASEPILCPVLVVHGGQDPIATLDGQQPFHEAGPPGDSTLKVWEDGEHTIYNRSAERTAYVADWFSDRLCPQEHLG